MSETRRQFDAQFRAFREFFDASGGTYGSLRVTQHRWRGGYRVSQNTVSTLMADLGLGGRMPRGV
jgi:hypothetical protein